MALHSVMIILKCVVCFDLINLLSAVRLSADRLGRYSEGANKSKSLDNVSANVKDGQTMSFYVYRAQSISDYPLENVNVASLGGAMWYLHHEIIYTCTGAGGLGGSRAGGSGIVGERKFNISRITRHKLHVRPTQALLRTGIHFSGLTAFDGGKATGPWRNNKLGVMGEVNQFGYTVGCGRLGEYPHEDWKTGPDYPNAIWYSLMGACPTQRFNEKTKQCITDQPGGHCPPGVMPTGAPDCTYQYEEAGEIDIDELVGITPKWKSRAEFCKQCGTEGDGWKRGGCGLDFWGRNLADVRSNNAQVNAARKLFEKKYPGTTDEKDLIQAPCDFNKWKYGYSRWNPYHWR